MAHDRKLVLTGVSLTQARLRGVPDFQAAKLVRDNLEREMVESGYLAGAPFKWIGLTIRYGLVEELYPRYSRICKSDGELPLVTEIDTHELLGASLEKVIRVFRSATLRALVHAGKKYGLKTDRFEALLSEAGSSG